MIGHPSASREVTGTYITAPKAVCLADLSVSADLIVRLVETESILASRYIYKAWLTLNKPVAQSQPRHLHLLGPVYETNFLVNHYFRLFVYKMTNTSLYADWSSIN